MSNDVTIKPDLLQKSSKLSDFPSKSLVILAQSSPRSDYITPLISTPNDSREIILRPLRPPSHLLVRSRFHSDFDHSYKGQERTILDPGTESIITSNLKHRPLTLARNNTPKYLFRVLESINSEQGNSKQDPHPSSPPRQQSIS
jgi:hypothetical protein